MVRYYSDIHNNDWAGIRQGLGGEGHVNGIEDISVFIQSMASTASADTFEAGLGICSSVFRANHSFFAQK